MPDVIRMKGRIALSAGLALPLATAGVWLFVAGGSGDGKAPAVLLPPGPGIGEVLAASTARTATPLGSGWDGPSVDAEFLAFNQVPTALRNQTVPGMGMLRA